MLLYYAYHYYSSYNYGSNIFSVTTPSTHKKDGRLAKLLLKKRVVHNLFNMTCDLVVVKKVVAYTHLLPTTVENRSDKNRQIITATYPTKSNFVFVTLEELRV